MIIYRDNYKTKIHGFILCFGDQSVNTILVLLFLKAANTNMILMYDLQEKEP